MITAYTSTDMSFHNVLISRVVELLNAFGLILLFQNYLFPNKIKPYHAIIIQRRRIKPCIMILLFIYLFQPFIGNTMMSLNKSNIFKLDVKQCTTRVLSIYVASPATSPANSATLTYVTKIASWRHALHWHCWQYWYYWLNGKRP